MSKLKGIKKLNKVVSAQLKPFGIASAFLGTEYSYFFDSEKVEFQITENDFADQHFIDFIKERFNYDVEYSFIISLLHEVGHHLNNDDIVDSIEDFCQDEKERISEEMATAET